MLSWQRHEKKESFVYYADRLIEALLVLVEIMVSIDDRVTSIRYWSTAGRRAPCTASFEGALGPSAVECRTGVSGP